jgi:hypothetical protein
MVTAPKSPASFAVMMPPAVVLASALEKLAQGEAKVQVFESLPLPETHVCKEVAADMEVMLNSMATDANKVFPILMEVSCLVM